MKKRRRRERTIDERRPETAALDTPDPSYRSVNVRTFLSNRDFHNPFPHFAVNFMSYTNERDKIDP
jgi:hypothetical protein